MTSAFMASPIMSPLAPFLLHRGLGLHCLITIAGPLSILCEPIICFYGGHTWSEIVYDPIVVWFTIQEKKNHKIERSFDRYTLLSLYTYNKMYPDTLYVPYASIDH